MTGTSRIRVPRGSWRLWGAVAVLLVANTEARAFYWYGWPGSQLRVEQSLLTPPAQVQPAAPNAPTRTPNPPVGPPVPVDRPPVGPPEHTPEPATGLLGLLGLGALAARKWAKKK